jgi:alkylhydroperoxidase family enzyme
MCQSRRSVPAAADGADEVLYDQIDDYETSALPERHKVALRFVDAMVWQPLAYPPVLIDAARAQFSNEEIVELVLDVARNAANKIAVAFAADAPTVTEGVELFDIDARGDVIFGLTPTT